jgi:DNA mismatch repair protein MSH5
MASTNQLWFIFSRVAEGLSLDSHATKCAEICGLPTRIVERAQHVIHLLSTHELGQLLDEDMSEAERLELEEAEVVCRRFLAWDLKAEAEMEDNKVNMKLGHVLGRASDQMDSGDT